MMNYWKLMADTGGVRLGDFLSESKIRIGFARTKEALKTTELESLRAIVRNEHPEAGNRQIISWAGNLNRFLHRISIGDRVLSYDVGTRLYRVAEVKSDAVFDGADHLPYVREVKWIGTVSRDQLSTNVRNMLGGIGTIYEINTLAQQEINFALSGGSTAMVTADEEDVEIHEFVNDVVDRAKEFLKDKILNLDWEKMQDLVAGLIRAMGYKTRVSGLGSDRGRDIVASPDGFGLEEPRIFIEVKHRKGQIGAPDVRSFVGGLRKARGLYISTGGFTREAQYEAERSEIPVTLVDIEVLAEMIIRYYDAFDSDARSLLPLKKIYLPL